MLRIEKNRKDVEVSVEVTRSRFNSIFWKAFAIACGIHLAAILAIQIKYHFFPNEVILPPSSVTIDMQNPSNANVSPHIIEARQQLYNLAPIPSEPQITFIENQPYFESMQYGLFDANPFKEIETLNPFEDIRKKGDPIQIYVEGPFSDFIIRNSDDFSVANVDDIGKYDVRIDRNGEIFWFAHQQTPKDPANRSIGELILKKILFKDVSTMTNAEITIVFNKI